MNRLLALAGVLILAISAGPNDAEHRDQASDASPRLLVERRAQAFGDTIRGFLDSLLHEDISAAKAEGWLERIEAQAAGLGGAMERVIHSRLGAGEVDEELIAGLTQRVEIAGEAFGRAVEELMEARFSAPEADLDQLASQVEVAAREFAGAVLGMVERVAGEDGEWSGEDSARARLIGELERVEMELARLDEETRLTREKLGQRAEELRARAGGLRRRLEGLDQNRGAQRGQEGQHMALMGDLAPEQMEEVHAWLESAPEFMQEHVGQMMEMMHGEGGMGMAGRRGQGGMGRGMMGQGFGPPWMGGSGPPPWMQGGMGMMGPGSPGMHGPGGLGMAPQGGGQRIIMRRFGEEGEHHEGGDAWFGEGEWMELEGGDGGHMALRMAPGGESMMGFSPPEGWECEREMEEGKVEIECEWQGAEAPDEIPFGDGWECERESDDGRLEIECKMESMGAMGMAPSGDHQITVRRMPGGEPGGRGMEMMGPRGRGGQTMMGQGGRRGRGGPGGMGNKGQGGPQVVPFPGGIVVLFGNQGQGMPMGGGMGGPNMGMGMMGLGFAPPWMGGRMGMEGMHGPEGMMGGGMDMEGMHRDDHAMDMDMEGMHGPEGMMGGGMDMEGMHGPEGMMDGGMDMEGMHGPEGMMEGGMDMEGMHGPEGMMGGGMGMAGMHEGGPQVIPFPGGVVILFGCQSMAGMHRGEHDMGGGMGMGGFDDMTMHTPDGEMFDPRIHLGDAGHGQEPVRGGSSRHGYPL